MTSRILQSYSGFGPVSSSARFMSTSRGRNISRTFPALISFPTFPLVDPRFVVAIERLSPIFSWQSIHRSEDRTLSLNFKIPSTSSRWLETFGSKGGRRESIVESILRGCQRLVPAGGNNNIIRGLPNLAGDRPLRPL